MSKKKKNEENYLMMIINSPEMQQYNVSQEEIREHVKNEDWEFTKNWCIFVFLCKLKQFETKYHKDYSDFVADACVKAGKSHEKWLTGKNKSGQPYRTTVDYCAFCAFNANTKMIDLLNDAIAAETRDNLTVLMDDLYDHDLFHELYGERNMEE